MHQYQIEYHTRDLHQSFFHIFVQLLYI